MEEEGRARLRDPGFVASLLEADSPFALEEEVSSALGISDVRANLRNGIAVDFIVYSIMFAKARGWDAGKTTALLQCMDNVLRRSFPQAFAGQGKPLAIEDSYALYRQFMLQHATPSASGEDPLFSEQDVQALTDYMSSGLYRHYALYSHVYSSERPTVPMSIVAVVDTPMPPQPLSEADMLPAAAAALAEVGHEAE